MLDDLISQDHDHDAIISREVLLPAGEMKGAPAVTGVSWAPAVYDYIFSDGMSPHHVEAFMKESQALKLAEILVIKQEDYI